MKPRINLSFAARSLPRSVTNVREWTVGVIAESKTKASRVFATWLAIAVASTAISAPATDDKRSHPANTAKGAASPEWAGQFGRASLPAIWQTASAASEKIAGALAARKLEGIAGWAETIHLAAHALEDQVKLDDAGRQKRLDGALRQAAQIADAVIDAAQHNKTDETAEAYRRLASALALAKLRLPKTIVGVTQ